MEVSINFINYCGDKKRMSDHAESNHSVSSNEESESEVEEVVMYKKIYLLTNSGLKIELYISSKWTLKMFKQVAASCCGYPHVSKPFALVENKNGKALQNNFFDSLESGAVISAVIIHSESDQKHDK